MPQSYWDIYNAPRLRVLHPGYEDGSNELLALVATDGEADTPGIQFHIVHTACAIIANNPFDGWLSRSRDPNQDLAEMLPSELLPVCDYYFHLPLSANLPAHVAGAALSPYPILPIFHEWHFPHLLVPEPWKLATIRPLQRPVPAQQRDKTCRLTKHVETTESAHIVPFAGTDWLARNTMHRCVVSGRKTGRDTMSADENLLQLRQDVHSQ